jgi:ribosomal protein L15
MIVETEEREVDMTPESQANARLIAASPDLLRVLKNSLVCLDARKEFASFAESAREAIAEAEGRAK